MSAVIEKQALTFHSDPVFLSYPVNPSGLANIRPLITAAHSVPLSLCIMYMVVPAARIRLGAGHAF